MTNKQKIKSWGLAALLATPVFITSCSEEKETLNAPVVNWNLPADTVLAVNDLLDFAPEVVSEDPATTYQWTINGSAVSTEKDYQFQATEAGSYVISFVTTGAGQQVEKKIEIQVRKQYGGFYVINEGWFGHHVASFNYVKNTMPLFADYDAFVAQTPTNVTPGATGVCGALRGKDFYLLTKGEPFLNKMDAATWNQTAVLNGGNTGDFGEASAISFLSDDAAILTGSKGAFKLDTRTLNITDTITTKRTTDVQVDGNYIYMIENDSLSIYNAKNLALVRKNIVEANTGFAVAGNSVWAANMTALVKIEGETVTSVDLPESYAVAFDAYTYHPTSLKASKDGSELFFVKNDGWTNKVAVAYDIADNTVRKFADAPENFSFYGAGIQVDPKTGYVYLIYTEDGWGTHYMNNRIVVMSPEGEVKETVNYSGEYWFPSSLVFE